MPHFTCSADLASPPHKCSNKVTRFYYSLSDDIHRILTRCDRHGLLESSRWWVECQTYEEAMLAITKRHL